MGNMRSRGSISILLLAWTLASCTSGSVDSPADRSVGPEVRDDAAGIDAPSECPSALVLWEEHGICAPRLDKCENPWELPLVGGGCVAVGPRGCPKLWDPEAKVDCEAGELMEYAGSACPEGFVLSESEVACVPHFSDNCPTGQLPLLGGDCRTVGPEAAEQGRPSFDECPVGNLAMVDGGCAQIGPRACPILWNQEGDVECEAGEVLACPEGWSPSTNSLYCDPGYEVCGEGEIAVIGGGCKQLTTSVEDCPVGLWPEANDDTGATLFVSASSNCAVECGSKEAPYGKIQAALDNAPEDATVLVAKGQYDEGLLITKSVQIHGVCQSHVTISGHTTVPGSAFTEQASIVVTGDHEVGVSGLSVQSGVAGILMTGGAQVSITDVELAGSKSSAVVVESKSEAELERVWVHDTLSGSEGTQEPGLGILVRGGSRLTSFQVLVEGAHGAGINATGDGVTLELRETTVRGTQADADGSGGSGVQIMAGAHATLNDSVIEKNRAFGIALAGGSILEGHDSVIRTTLVDGAGKGGAGVLALDKSEILLRNCVVSENGRFGVLLKGKKATLIGCSIINSGIDSDAQGAGIEATSGEVEIDSCLLLGNLSAGAMFFGQNTDMNTVVEIAGTSILDQRLDSQEDGFGLYVAGGANLSARYSLVEDSTKVGASVDGEWTSMTFDACNVRGTMTDSKDWFGMGIQITGKATFHAANSLVEVNHLAGLYVQDKSTAATLSRSEVRFTKDIDEGGGYGIQVGFGAHMTLDGSVIHRSSSSGILAVSEESRVDILGSEISESGYGSADHVGYAMQLSDKAAAYFIDSRLLENSHGTLLVIDEGTELTVAGSVIEGTLNGLDNLGGYGVISLNRAMARISDSVISEGHGEGIFAQEEGWVEAKRTVIRNCRGRGALANLNSHIALDSVLVDNTVPLANGDFGQGVEIIGGSFGSLDRCAIINSKGVGVVAGHPSTEVILNGSLVRSDGNAPMGENLGIQIQQGASATITGSAIVASGVAGVSTVHDSSSTKLLGSVVYDTMCKNGHTVAWGVAGMLGGDASVEYSKVSANGQIGIGALGAGSLVYANNFAVDSTGRDDSCGASAQGTGDGATALEGATLDLRNGYVVDSARCGAFVQGSTFILLDSILAGNTWYGLAYDGDKAQVSYETSGNHIFGNSLGKPAAYAADISDNPEGFQPAEAPEVQKLGVPAPVPTPGS